MNFSSTQTRQQPKSGKSSNDDLLPGGHNLWAQDLSQDGSHSGVVYCELCRKNVPEDGAVYGKFGAFGRLIHLCPKHDRTGFIKFEDIEE